MAKGHLKGAERSAACGKGLTDDDIRAIRLDPRPYQQVGADYGISYVMVHFIKKRKRWKSVEDA